MTFQKRFSEKSFISLEDNLYLYYKNDFLSKKEADYYYDIFSNNLNYLTDDESKITLFGKKLKIPRKQVSYGEDGVSYRFSGSNIPVKSWDEDDNVCIALRKLRKKVKLWTSVNYNYVLINCYKDGNQYIGFHRDAEEDIIQEYGIASVTLGAERDFQFRPYKFMPKGKYKKLEISLEHGSFLHMKYPTNEYWQHSLPKRSKVKRPRINLTFRKVKCVNS